MKNIKLLGLGSLLSIASIGATLPFVVACGSNQADDQQISKINNLLTNQQKEIKKLEKKLSELDTKVDALSGLLKKTSEATKTSFELLVAEYNKIKNNPNLVKDLQGQEIKIEELTTVDLKLDDKYAEKIGKIFQALTQYKDKLTVNSKTLSDRIDDLTGQVSALEKEKTALKQEITDGKNKVDEIDKKIQAIIEQYNKIFNIKTENK